MQSLWDVSDFARVKVISTTALVCCKAIAAASVLAFPVHSKPDADLIFQDWSVTCPNEGPDCVLAQTSSAQSDRLWLGTLHLKPRHEGGATLVVQVPSGVHLGSGIFVGVRQPLKQLTYQVCSSAMCTASGALTRDELNQWRRARKAELRYRPSVQAPPVAFDVSLMGITAALQYAHEHAQ